MPRLKIALQFQLSFSVRFSFAGEERVLIIDDFLKLGLPGSRFPLDSVKLSSVLGRMVFLSRTVSFADLSELVAVVRPLTLNLIDVFLLSFRVNL